MNEPTALAARCVDVFVNAAEDIRRLLHQFAAGFLKEADPVLLEQLRVIYSGILVGELMRDKLVPGHALAMSNIIDETIPRAELDYEQAILYLQRKDFKLESEAKGWQLVTYKQHPLGWINVLSNRINNYYPKELRILKDK